MGTTAQNSGMSFTQKPCKMGIVRAQYNDAITRALLEGVMDVLQAHGFTADDICAVEVPGAVEIPFMAQELIVREKAVAVIALGAVIRGETTHYDYVCQQVSIGCQTVALNQRVPVVFGVLTTENEAQAWDRLGGKHGHKGKEAAYTALSLMQTLSTLG